MINLAVAAPTKPLFDNQMLRRLIVPLVIEQALAMSVGMVDTMMVSSVGEAAVSGVSLVDLLTVLIINIFAALSTGGAVVISQYLGAKNQTKSCESASQLVLLSAILGTMVGAFCFIFAPTIMTKLFGALDADVYAAGLLYLRVCAFSFPFLSVYNAGAAIFRSTGNSKVSMRVSVVMNIINVVGNAVCIFGLRLGVLGVAIPSLISRVVAAAMILTLCTRRNAAVRVVIPRRIEPKLAGRILTIGIPSAFENSLFQGGRILVVGMIATYGTIQITANAIAYNLTALGCIPGTAFSLAMISVVGRCIGADDTDQAIYYTKKMMFWISIIGGIANILVIVLSPLLLLLYSVSAQTSSLAYLLTVIHAGAGILFWPLAFVFPNALRAANDVKYTMTISIISMGLCRLLGGYILCMQMGLGATGIWLAMVIDWVFRCVFFVWRYLNGKWKEKYVADTAA